MTPSPSMLEKARAVCPMDEAQAGWHMPLPSKPNSRCGYCTRIALALEAVQRERTLECARLVCTMCADPAYGPAVRSPYDMDKAWRFIHDEGMYRPTCEASAIFCAFPLVPAAVAAEIEEE